MKALTDEGFTVSRDDRVKNAKVLEVPANESDKALDALQQLQTEHPEYGIVIRTDKYVPPKKR